MNSSYLNMAAGAFLGSVFVVMSVSIVSEAIFHTEAPEQEGFAIEVTEPAAGGAVPEEEQIDIAMLLQDADPAEGESSFRKCAACHSIEEGGPNKVGPNLWSVVNRPIASHEGFSYSSAMEEFSQGGEVVWDYEHLAGFLQDPRGYISGTAMGFAGLSRPEELANVIAYLRQQADEPAPLPEPGAAEGGEAAAAEAAGGGDEAAPAEAAGDGSAQEAGQGDAVQDGAAPSSGGDAASKEPAAEEAAPDGSGEGAGAEEPAAETGTDGDAAGSSDQAGEEGDASADALRTEEAPVVEEERSPEEAPVQ